jgi:hypothetical protein
MSSRQLFSYSSSIFLVAGHALFPYSCHVSSLGFGAEKKRGKRRSLACMPGANDQKGKTILLAEGKIHKRNNRKHSGRLWQASPGHRAKPSTLRRAILQEICRKAAQ